MESEVIRPLGETRKPLPERIDYKELSTRFEGASDEEALAIFFELIDVKPHLIDISTGRLAEYSLRNAGLIDRENVGIRDAVVISHLAPLAAAYQRPEYARLMIDSLPNATSRAYGFRDLARRLSSAEDAARYLQEAREARPRCVEAQVNLGSQLDPFHNRAEMIEDVYLLARALGFEDLVRQVEADIPSQRREELDLEVPEYAEALKPKLHAGMERW